MTDHSKLHFITVSVLQRVRNLMAQPENITHTLCHQNAWGWLQTFSVTLAYLMIVTLKFFYLGQLSDLYSFIPYSQLSIMYAQNFYPILFLPFIDQVFSLQFYLLMNTLSKNFPFENTFNLKKIIANRNTYRYVTY